MAVEFPVLDPVRIPALGVTLHDARTQDKAGHAETTTIGMDVLNRRLLAVRPAAIGCPAKAQDAHEAQLLDRVHADLDRWVAGPEFLRIVGDDIVEDDSSYDPRLSHVLCAVIADGGANLGSWLTYNIKRESETPRTLTVSAMPWTGCIAARGFTVRQTWSAIMRFVLANDLHSGGQAIDFIEWRFPTRAAHQWQGAVEFEGASADQLIAAVSVGNDLTRDGTVPKKIRRR